MASTLIRRLREVISTPHLQAKGAENVRGEDMWLDNDDIRPLKLSDRSWGAWTYFTFWFSASELGQLSRISRLLLTEIKLLQSQIGMRHHRLKR